MKSYSDYGITIPSNKTSGEISTTCPKCSHERKPENQKIKCLGVNLDKKVWRCNHCGWDGGLPMNQNNYTPPKTYIKPIWKNKTELADKIVKWFEKDRKISQKTLLTAKVTTGKEWMPHKQCELNTIQYNYLRNGELINIKYRSADKGFKLCKDAELIFYNIDSLIGAKTVFITEGENDALALIESGIQREGVGVLSVPNGANLKSNNLQYIDNCFDLFDQIEIIIIATDDDPAGRKLREELAERLGKEKCYFLTYNGRKDINEVLIVEGIQGVIECCSNKKEFPIVGAFPVSSFTDELKDLYHNGLDMGVGTGIEEFDKLLKFAKGYLTVITGISSQGKSSMLDQICILLSFNSNWKFAFYSPENKPTKLHLSNIIRKLIGKTWFGANRMTESEMNMAVNWLEGRFFFIKPEKDFTLKSILDKSKELKVKYGIDALIIDAWNKLEHKHGKSAETSYVSEQLDILGNFIEMIGIHCFLVAHPTKMLKDKNDKTGLNYEVPNLYSIAGSAAFFSKADNGICVYRDYVTGRTKLYVQKVRFSHWGELGYTEWQYEKDSGRFNIVKPGDSIFEDKYNWITKNQTQGILDIPTLKEKPYDGGIIINNEDVPF